MSANEKKIGDMGEGAVCDYIKKMGFVILERNFRIRGGEVDIIAKDGDTLVFIEVKTRKNSKYAPSEAVDLKKQRFIIKTAEAYLYTKDLYEVDVRFDVAEVIYGTKCGIHYMENAFWRD